MIANAQSVQPLVPPPQPWRKKFPAVFSGIMAFLQCVVTFVIIGCEIGSMLINIVTATIYVGLWAGLFFMFAWISQASSCMYQLFIVLDFCFVLKPVAVVVVVVQHTHL
jgi:hypothetical protein